MAFVVGRIGFSNRDTSDNKGIALKAVRLQLIFV